MEQGTIARLMDGKGYGFIKREGDEKDLFFHASEMQEGVNFDDLREGEAVTFEISESDKGPNAVNVGRA